VRLSGVLDGVAELRVAVQEATEAIKRGVPTLALVDELHRFNKAQQDAFLPHVESGTLTVIGQTTENVSFRIRNALLSRLKVITLKALDKNWICNLVDRALCDSERGLGALQLSITNEARDLIATLSAGDARRALTALEWSAAGLKEGQTEITKETVTESFGTPPPNFDQDGDYHYDCISAFIKSMRGSDPDAALYYMIRALEGGEDPLFITRRMIIFASEDASCDPRALELALNVDEAVQRVGMPEGRIPLAQGVVYLSSCAKSNRTYTALREMEGIVATHPELEIPKRLRNAPTKLMKEQGNSLGYKYPHDFPGAFVPERYLPKEIENLIVYQPSDRGIDAKIKERLDQLRSLIKGS
jgi:putative ATPase